MKEEREKQNDARRSALGLDELATPHEFICPITCERMSDPVVASDGYSYERDAIE